MRYALFPQESEDDKVSALLLLVTNRKTLAPFKTKRYDW